MNSSESSIAGMDLRQPANRRALAMKASPTKSLPGAGARRLSTPELGRFARIDAQPPPGESCAMPHVQRPVADRDARRLGIVPQARARAQLPLGPYSSYV